MKKTKTKNNGLLILLYIHLAILAGLVYIFIMSLMSRAGALELFSRCPSSWLNLYCPSCGGTRAITALLRFDFVSSMIYNPNPLLWACTLIYVDIRTLFLYFRKGVTEKVYFSKPLFILLVTVFFGNFLLKNALMLGFGIDIIGDHGEYWNALLGR